MSSKKIALASPDSQKCQLPWTFVSREFMALLSNTKTPSHVHSVELLIVSECGRGVRMALELSAIVGMVLMAIGSMMVLWGLLLCYTTKVT